MVRRRFFGTVRELLSHDFTVLMAVLQDRKVTANGVPIAARRSRQCQTEYATASSRAFCRTKRGALSDKPHKHCLGLVRTVRAGLIGNKSSKRKK